MLTLGLTAAGIVAGGLIFKPIDPNVAIETVGLRSSAAGAAGAIGFGIGTVLTGYFNIFRENVVDLKGHGELHPKSPSLISRS